MGKALAGFQVERNLSLVYAENGPDRCAGEFVVRIGRIGATIQEVDPVSRLRGSEVHRSDLRNLSLVYAENGPDRCAGEFVVRIGRIGATIQEVDPVSRLRGSEVHRS